MTQLIQTPVRLAPDQKRDLKKIAQAKRASVSDIIRWAIDDYISSFFTPDCPTDETISTSQDTDSPAR